LTNGLFKGCQFSATHWVANILVSPVDWCEIQTRGSRRRLVIHADNERLYRASAREECREQNTMKKAPHSAYSPDRPPSDFCFFGSVKELSARQELLDVEGLVGAVNAIFVSLEINRNHRTIRRRNYLFPYKAFHDTRTVLRCSPHGGTPCTYIRALDYQMSGTQNLIAPDNKELKSEVAFTFIVIRLGRRIPSFSVTHLSHSTHSPTTALGSSTDIVSRNSVTRFKSCSCSSNLAPRGRFSYA
jgi:hypothetical protein